MGRTAPPYRLLVEKELDRLGRFSARLRDPEDRRALERAIKEVYRVLDAYRFVPLEDPLEPLIVAALLLAGKLLENTPQQEC
ncbi:MAG: hypothetical protein F7C34_01805 [Desulfurococcales archaeon]|nr:hypothetical protein [Desulfurococcales archaeon]